MLLDDEHTKESTSNGKLMLRPHGNGLIIYAGMVQHLGTSDLGGIPWMTPYSWMDNLTTLGVSIRSFK